MAKVFMGCSISEQTFHEFDEARINKLKKDKKLVNKSQAVEEALLMFIKKYGEKK